MKSRKSLFLGSLCTYLTCFCLPVLADQCAYIDKQQAIAAISRLSLNDTIYNLCEPCGDKIAEPSLIFELGAATVDYKNYWQVMVNGKGIDLAYVFVDSGLDGKLVNLAIASDCEVTGVSATIDVEKIKPLNQRGSLRDR